VDSRYVTRVPLVACVLVNFAIGIAAALAAARELRASPRAAHQTLAFRAIVLYDALIAIPIATWLIARFTDWTLSYTFDSAHVPSLALAICVLLHGLAAVAGFGLGARLLRDHRPHLLPLLLAACAFAFVVGLVVARHRLGVVGTFAQYRGRFGLRGVGSAGLVGPFFAIAIGWLAGGAHMLWSLARRL
jgi:hypothetical protein